MVWASRDPAGIERCTVSRRPGGWSLAGALVRGSEDGPVYLSYVIGTDRRWVTKRVRVQEVVKGKKTVLELESRSSTWYLGGRKVEALNGCADVDLEASPVTNTLPIKRVGQRVGSKLDLSVAWVRFPSLEVQPLERSYERVGKVRYVYRSATGVRTEVEVDGFGLVRRYGDRWQALEPAMPS